MTKVPTSPLTVTVAVAAEMLGLSAWQVKERCDAGLIAAVFDKNRRLVFVDSIHAYLAGLPTQRPDGAA